MGASGPVPGVPAEWNNFVSTQRLDVRASANLSWPQGLVAAGVSPSAGQEPDAPFVHEAAKSFADATFETWTTGFDPDPDAACHLDKVFSPLDHTGTGLEVASLRGAGLTDIKAYVAGVLATMQWLDYTVPAANKTAECAALAGMPRGSARVRAFKWYCFPNLWQLEYGRDPFGAGGFTPATRETWLEGFRELAKGFKACCSHDDRVLFGPGTVEDGRATTISEPLAWFLDDAVAQHTPMGGISVEIEADDPVQASAVVDKVRQALAARGIRSDRDGGEPLLMVSDLRLKPDGLPAGLRGDPVRASTYLGAFGLGASLLLADRVALTIFGRYVPGIPGCTAKGSGATGWPADLRWHDVPGIQQGAKAPAGWGKDIATMAVLERCVDLVQAKDNVAVLVGHGDCVEPFDQHECTLLDRSVVMYGKDRGAQGIPATATRFVVIAVADWRVGNPASTPAPIDVQLQGLGSVSKAFVRQMSFDGATPTWTREWSQQGNVQVSAGMALVRFQTRSPAMHYAEVFLP